MEADEPLITTGVLSQSPTQFAQLWSLREGLTESVSKEGKAYKYDITVPLQAFKDVVDTTREHLRAKGLYHEGAVKRVIGYGHVGDGRLFLYSLRRLKSLSCFQVTFTLMSSRMHTRLRLRLHWNRLSTSSSVSTSGSSTSIWMLTGTPASYKGSISAEHGVGRHKVHALHYSKSATSLEWMKKIKQLFDPKGIMNPGKVIV
jgi:FAD/FMN-containing dehydrogenase